MFTFLYNTWFFTATVNSRQQLLCNEARISILLNSLKYFCKKKRIHLHCFVIMPNHIHLLLTLSENESATNFERDFLKFTSQELIRLLLGNGQQEELNKYLSTQNDRIYQVWERRPRWIKIDNSIILEQKMKHIHENPVQQKWNLAKYAEAYPWSSASYYLVDISIFPFLLILIIGDFRWLVANTKPQEEIIGDFRWSMANSIPQDEITFGIDFDLNQLKFNQGFVPFVSR